MLESCNILLVCAQLRFYNRAASLFEDCDGCNVFHAVSSSDAKKILMTKSINAIIVNSPLTDGFGLDFAVTCAEKKNYPVLFLVKKELYSAVSERVADTPLLILATPTTTEILQQSVSLLEAEAKKRKNKKHDINSPDEAAQSRLIGRAKLILISSHGLTEEQAHKYIEKRAMEERKTRLSIAQNIITSYGY